MFRKEQIPVEMPGKHSKAARASIFCAPLWAVPSSMFGFLSPAGEKQRQKLLRSCYPKASRQRCLCLPGVQPWACSDTWSLFSFHTGESAEQEDETIYLRFENQTSTPVEVLWFSHTGEEQHFYKLNPRCSITQETFCGNVWLAKEDSASRRLLKRVKVVEKGVQRQLCYIRPLSDGKSADPVLDEFPCPDVRIPSCYTRILETELGIPIVAESDVCMPALHAAADIIRHMLEGCPPYVVKELKRHQCKVALIGRSKVTTDILEHSHLRGSPTPDGRDWDVGVRGLGGTLVIPTCTVGEENVLRAKKDRFGGESILVHEFGHTVMEVSMSSKQQQRIKDCYIKNKHRYTPGIYMVADEKEYWAEGSQSWFNASKRKDVNDGVNTREKLWKHDPELASLLREIYGNLSWRYDFTPIPEE